MFLATTNLITGKYSIRSLHPEHFTFYSSSHQAHYLFADNGAMLNPKVGIVEHFSKVQLSSCFKMRSSRPIKRPYWSVPRAAPDASSNHPPRHECSHASNVRLMQQKSETKPFYQPRFGTTGINAPIFGHLGGLESIGIWGGAACTQTL